MIIENEKQKNHNWLKEENATKKYIVDFSAKEASEGHISGVRVTEFVKPKTKVHGKGTQAVPWEFESQYIITAKSSDEAMGKISEDSKVQYIDNGDNVVIQISPVEGYGYAGNSLEGKNTGKITIDNQNITEITLKEIDDSEDVIVYFLPRNDIEYKVNHYYETLETGKYGTAEQEVLKNTIATVILVIIVVILVISVICLISIKVLPPSFTKGIAFNTDISFLPNP